MQTGIEEIAQERAEQIEKHGRTVALDVVNNCNGQLIHAVQALISGGEYELLTESDMEMLPEGWDEAIFRKMMCKPYRERVICAGTLLAAEIDRFDATPSLLPGNVIPLPKTTKP